MMALVAVYVLGGSLPAALIVSLAPMVWYVQANMGSSPNPPSAPMACAGQHGRQSQVPGPCRGCPRSGGGETRQGPLQVG